MSPDKISFKYTPYIFSFLFDINDADVVVIFQCQIKCRNVDKFCQSFELEFTDETPFYHHFSDDLYSYA